MNKGRADIIVGLDYGDEGKGRITDQKLESGEYSVVARFNGGNNAGHTIIDPQGEKIILNAIPSGVLYPNMINYVGSGSVVDPTHLVKTEIPRVEKSAKLDGRLKISALATAITPIHILDDRLGDKMIGTTGKGIGPAYTAKVKRAQGDVIHNLRLAEILANPVRAKLTLEAHLAELWKKCKREGRELSIKELDAQLEEFIESTLILEKRGFIEKDNLWLTKQVEAGRNVLMEGAQAYGLDVGLGIVPFTTSSHTFAGNAFVGGDLSPRVMGRIFGVSKLIPSRVGSGPFVGELGGNKSETYCAEKKADGSPRYSLTEEANMYIADELLRSDDPFEFGVGLRMKTAEYGATTGRPRRVGIIDLYRMANAARHTGIDELFLTKFDSLKIFEGNNLFKGKLPVIIGYRRDGRMIDYVPATSDELSSVEPMVELVNIPEIMDEKAFVEMVQQSTRARVAGLGVGPGRNEMRYLLAS